MSGLVGHPEDRFSRVPAHMGQSGILGFGSENYNDTLNIADSNCGLHGQKRWHEY